MKEDDMKEVLNTDLIEEMDRFQKKTAPEIIKLLNEEDYLVATGVMGLIGIVKMIINNIGNEILLNYAIEALQENNIEIMEEGTEETNEED